MLKMREEWTDERLDDLNARVGELSRRMDAGFAELRKEMNERFDKVDARFDSLQRTIVYFSASMVVALLGLIGGLFAVVLSGGA